MGFHGARFVAGLALLLYVPAVLAQPEATSREPRNWTFAAETDLYLLEDVTFLMPIVTADGGGFHFEGRWNYEDLETLSLWAGVTIEVGSRVELSVTPMVGGILGRTKGVAPGLELSVDWRRLSFASASEHVFNFEGREGNFFYNWSELTVQMLPWLSVGLATQRTRLYHGNREINRGILVSFERESLSLSFYGLNVDDSPLWIVALAAEL